MNFYIDMGNNISLYTNSLIISKNMPQRIKILESVIQENNEDEIKRAAHSIKGTALMLSFVELARLASLIEENANTDPKAIRTLYDQIASEWKIVEQIVDKELSSIT